MTTDPTTVSAGPAEAADEAAHGEAAQAPPRGNGDTCRHWLKGQCRVGDGCNFFHPPHTAPLTGGRANEPKKWCRFAFRGRCPFGPNGDACVYTHLEEWLACTPADRDGMALPPMLPACASNMRRDLHNALLYSFLAQPAKYRSGAKELAAEGFDSFPANMPAHLRLHEIVETLAQHAHYDIASLKDSDQNLAALRWFIEHVQDNFMQATPVGAPSPRVPSPQTEKPSQRPWEVSPRGCDTPTLIMRDLQDYGYVGQWSGPSGMFSQAAHLQLHGGPQHGYGTTHDANNGHDNNSGANGHGHQPQRRGYTRRFYDPFGPNGMYPAGQPPGMAMHALTMPPHGIYPSYGYDDHSMWHASPHDYTHNGYHYGYAKGGKGGKGGKRGKGDDASERFDRRGWGGGKEDAGGEDSERASPASPEASEPADASAPPADESKKSPAVLPADAPEPASTPGGEGKESTGDLPDGKTEAA